MRAVDAVTSRPAGGGRPAAPRPRDFPNRTVAAPTLVRALDGCLGPLVGWMGAQRRPEGGTVGSSTYNRAAGAQRRRLGHVLEGMPDAVGALQWKLCWSPKPGFVAVRRAAMLLGSLALVGLVEYLLVRRVLN
jgi:hypothetical protein